MSKGQEEMRASAAHQVLDLIMEECRYWQGRDEARRGGYAILYAEAKGIIDREEQAARQQAPAEQEPVAWMHNDPSRVDVIHESVRSLLKNSAESAGHLHRPLDRSERYTIPLYAAPIAAEQVPAEQERVGQWSDDEGLSWCDGSPNELASARESGWLTRTLYAAPIAQAAPLRYTNDGALAECPCCGSLDVGGAHDTVHCYRCGLTVTKPRPLHNAIAAWNARTGRVQAAPQPEQSAVLERVKLTSKEAKYHSAACVAYWNNAVTACIVALAKHGEKSHD